VSQPDQHQFLRTEKVPPVDVDGVRAVVVGTIGWLIALLLVLWRHEELVAQGRQWWLTTTLLGLALAIPGMAYCLRRRTRLRAGRPADPTEGLLSRRNGSGRSGRQGR
jgi:hypothetical protein